MEIVAIAHKREQGGAMIELSAAELRMATGVSHDLAGKPGSRQITLLSLESWREAEAELAQILPWTIRRANLLIAGHIFSAADVGKVMAIGTVRIEITKETVPCSLMDKQIPGLQKILGNWRGGVCGRIVADGDIARGDAAHWLEVEV